MSKLIDRAFHAHGKTGMVETKGPSVSLYLHWYQSHVGTRYVLRRGLGLNNNAILELFVPGVDPRFARK